MRSTLREAAVGFLYAIVSLAVATGIVLSLPLHGAAAQSVWFVIAAALSLVLIVVGDDIVGRLRRPHRRH